MCRSKVHENKDRTGILQAATYLFLNSLPHDNMFFHRDVGSQIPCGQSKLQIREGGNPCGTLINGWAEA